MSNDELFRSFDMLKSGVKDLFTQRVISNANDQVNQIKSSELDEMKQRSALQGVANQLTTHLAGLGTPATTIAQVAGAIGPKQFASADQAILEGTLTGDKSLVNQGISADKATTANQMEMFNAKTRASEESQKRLFTHQDALEQQRMARMAMMADAKDKPNSDQFKAALFGNRALKAEQNMQALTKEGYNRADAASSVAAGLPNRLRPETAQRQEQAERSFVNALLRRESGAAIAESEFTDAEKRYFPRSGDSAATIEQKRQNRLTDIQGLKAESGKAWDRMGGTAVPELGIGSNGSTATGIDINKYLK